MANSVIDDQSFSTLNCGSRFVFADQFSAPAVRDHNCQAFLEPIWQVDVFVFTDPPLNVSMRELVRQDRAEALALRPEQLRRQVHPTGERDAHGNVRTHAVCSRIRFRGCIRAHCDRMRETSTMHRFNPRDGVWVQRCNVTSKILSARLIVHLAVGGQGGQSIGYSASPRSCGVSSAGKRLPLQRW